MNKEMWNTPCIDLQGRMVTRECLYPNDGAPIELITRISKHEDLLTPAQMFDAIRHLDEYLAQCATARANMVLLLNRAMGEVVYT